MHGGRKRGCHGETETRAMPVRRSPALQMAHGVECQGSHAVSGPSQERSRARGQRQGLTPGIDAADSGPRLSARKSLAAAAALGKQDTGCSAELQAARVAMRAVEASPDAQALESERAQLGTLRHLPPVAGLHGALHGHGDDLDLHGQITTCRVRGCTAPCYAHSGALHPGRAPERSLSGSGSGSRASALPYAHLAVPSGGVIQDGRRH